MLPEAPMTSTEFTSGCGLCSERFMGPAQELLVHPSAVHANSCLDLWVSGEVHDLVRELHLPYFWMIHPFQARSVMPHIVFFPSNSEIFTSFNELRNQGCQCLVVGVLPHIGSKRGGYCIGVLFPVWEKVSGCRVEESEPCSVLLAVRVTKQRRIESTSKGVCRHKVGGF